MSLGVSVTDAGVGLALRRMAVLLRDMQPIYRAIGSKLEQNVNLRFDTKTAPNGSGWAAWAPATARARAAEGRGTLLEYTGRMRDSLTYFADNQGVEVGFGVDYAEQVERKRAMLFDGDTLGQQDLDDVLKAAMREFKKQLKLSGSLAL